MKLFVRVLSALIVASALPFTQAMAQSWPAGPIKLVAPTPPGGGVDTLARAIAAQLQNSLGVPVVVDNKPGGSAVIGTEFVARAAPDGNTLLMGYSVLATNKFLVQKLPYDLEADLIPVSYVGYIPLMLVAAPSFPANTVQELVALSKANPGKYAYASGGAGSSSHLSGEMLKHLAGADLTHIPYKGDAPALNDVLAGHVPMMFVTLTTALPHVKAGKLKALATTGDRRAALAPEFPTMIEAGRTRLRDQGVVHDSRAEENAARCTGEAQHRDQRSDGGSERPEADGARCDLHRRHHAAGRDISEHRDQALGPGHHRRGHQGRLTCISWICIRIGGPSADTCCAHPRRLQGKKKRGTRLRAMTPRRKWPRT